MKKIQWLMTAALVSGSFFYANMPARADVTAVDSTSVSQDTQAEQIVGEVIGLDSTKNTLTVKEETSQELYTLSVLNPDVFSNLKTGSRVKITVPTDQRTLATGLGQA